MISIRRGPAAFLFFVLIGVLVCALAPAVKAATVTTLGKTGSFPQSVTLDKQGNIYTGNYGSNNITQITPLGLSYTFAKTGNNPNGLETDRQGNFYTANYGSNSVSKITPGGVSTPLFASTGSGPNGIALDSAGNIYTPNFLNRSVSKISPLGASNIIASTVEAPNGVVVGQDDNAYINIAPERLVQRISPGGQLTVFGTTTGKPLSIAVDDKSNVYAPGRSSDNATTIITRINASGGSVDLATLQSGCNIYDVAIDSKKNLYLPLYFCSTSLKGSILKISPTGQVSSLGQITSPHDIALDSSGNLYVSDSTNDSLSKLTPTSPTETAPPPPDTPSAPSASAGVGKATVYVTPNPTDARYGSPTSYIIKASQDPTKTCTITRPATSCDITGLLAGSSYKFTAQAKLNDWTTASSASSNSIVPLKDYPLSVTKTGKGQGTVTSAPGGVSCGNICSARFDENTTVTLQATASSGSQFVGWSGAGCSGVGTCAIRMSEAKSVEAVFTERFTLSVSRSGSGTGSITSNPAGISCGSDCSGSFVDGTQIVLVAWPDGGSTFSGWSGGGCSGTGECRVTMDQARSIAAAFDPIPSHLLQVERTGGGSGQITSTPAGINCGDSCTHEFQENTSVTLQATALAGSAFVGWSGAGCSGVGECQISMVGARSVTAIFTPPPTPPGKFSLSVSKGGAGDGRIISAPEGISCGNSCNFDFANGTLVTLRAEPSSGSVFAGWSGEGCSGTGECQVTIDKARSVYALFTSDYPDPGFYPLSVASSGNGSGQITSVPAGINCGVVCLVDFAENDTVTLFASPNPGSEFTGWSGAGCSGVGICQVVMSEAENVVAHFTERFPLQITISGSGTGEVISSPAGIDCQPDCSADFASGSEVTLEAIPRGGALFTGWSGAGCSGTGECQVSIDKARSVNASFSQNYNLQVELRGTGEGSVISTPAGINCGNACSESFPKASFVSLSPRARNNSNFSGWSGAGCSGKGSCLVEMSKSQNVTAFFSHDIVLRVRAIKKKVTRKYILLTSNVRVSAAGRLRQVVLKGKQKLCTKQVGLNRAGSYKVKCRLKAKARKYLKKKTLSLSVKTSFSTYGKKSYEKNRVKIPRKR